MLGPNEIRRNENGVEVCQRKKKRAIPNVKGDDSKGYHYIDTVCNQPVTLSIAEGGKICPDCDKQPPVGWVKPRITNSAGVQLTKKELEECGVIGEDPSLVEQAPTKTEKKPRAIKKAVEAKVKKEVKKDIVVLEVPLSVLEENTDVAAILIRRTVDAFGQLPTTNFAESKRLIKLEEKLLALLEV